MKKELVDDANIICGLHYEILRTVSDLTGYLIRYEGLIEIDGYGVSASWDKSGKCIKFESELPEGLTIHDLDLVVIEFFHDSDLLPRPIACK